MTRPTDYIYGCPTLNGSNPEGERKTTENDAPPEAKRDWDEWVNKRKIDALAAEIDKMRGDMRALGARISRLHSIAVRRPLGEEGEEAEEEREERAPRPAPAAQISVEEAILARYYKDYPGVSDKK